jgi:O-antigen/teichoic acid export membrane protein
MTQAGKSSQARTLGAEGGSPDAQGTLVPEGRVRGAATVFSDYTSQLAARVASAVLSLVAVMITTRFLAPAGYATFAYYFVVATLIFTVSSAWTSTAVSRYAREELEERGRMTAVTWNRAVLVAPLALLSIVVVPGLKLLGALPPELGWAFVWLAIAYGLVWIVADHGIYLLEAEGRMKVSALLLVAQQGLYVVALVVIYVTGTGQNPLTLAAISLGAIVLVAIAAAGSVWRRAFWPPALDRPLLRRILLLSLPLIAFTVSQYVVRSVDLVVLRAFGSAHQVGLYAIAYQGYVVIAAITTVTPPVLTPLFVSLEVGKKGATIRRYLKRVVPQLTFVGSVLAGVAAPLIFALLPVVFGPKFGASARPLAILLVAAVLLSVTNLLAPVLVLHERGRAIAVINVLAAAMNIAGDIVTVGPLGMGINGPALVTGVTVGIVALGYLLVAAESLEVEPWLNPILFLPVIAGLVPSLILSGGARVAVGVGAALGSAAVITVWARPFDTQDADLLAKLDMPPARKRLALRGLALASR